MGTKSRHYGPGCRTAKTFVHQRSPLQSTEQPDTAAKAKKLAARAKFSETIVGALKSKKGVFASAMENDTSATAR